MRSLPILTTLVLIAGCASSETPEEPTAPAASADVTAPAPTAATPYTAAQIRDWNPPGSRIVFRIEDVGRPPVMQTIEFVDGDANRAVIEASVRNEAGAILEVAERTERTWEELRDHGAFPADRTKRDAVEVDVPVGRLSCWLYSVTSVEDGVPTTRTFYFAKKRPGPPVRTETVQNGALVSRMEMIEDSRVAGASSAP